MAVILECVEVILVLILAPIGQMPTPLKLAYIAPLTPQAVALVVIYKAAQGLSRTEAPKRTGLYLLLTGCAVAILSVLLLREIAVDLETQARQKFIFNGFKVSALITGALKLYEPFATVNFRGISPGLKPSHLVLHICFHHAHTVISKPIWTPYCHPARGNASNLDLIRQSQSSHS
jgi:hypothetical protein